MSCGVTSFCAPPTVWRMLIQHDLQAWRVTLREAVSAGEPLNPEVMAQVHAAWGVTLRDGFGQTETTAVVGNPPGQPVKPGSMGRPLPGYRVELLRCAGAAGRGGRAVPRSRAAAARSDAGLPRRCRRAPPRSCATATITPGTWSSRDADGYLTYVGRMDDVFKSSDYRISPFELESVLIEHAAVAEAAVVPSPDALRLSVPKAFVVLAAGASPDAATAASILQHVRARVAAFKRIRRLEFATLPKTISGKIRRVELRRLEESRPPSPARRPQEFWEEDLRGVP